MSKNFNMIEMKGRLYNYALKEIDTEKGTAIGGDVILEVDEEGTTATVRFFGYPNYNNGKINKTYIFLDEMMAGNYQTVVDDGDEANWLALTGSIDVSYFVAKNSTDGELARAQKMRGAFINPNKEKKYLNKWKADFLITGVQDVEADVERKLDRFLRVNGYIIDDFNERVLEAQFQARAEDAINYILGIDASFASPYFVSTWGKLAKINRTVVRENAFGDDEIDEFSSTQWVMTGMNPNAYVFGDETTITVEDYQKFRAALDELKDNIKNAANDTDNENKKDLAF